MVNGIGTQQVDGMQGFKKPDPAEMFKDLASKVGADENGITKDDLTTYLKKLQEEGKGDSREAKMISNMVDDFDNISGGTDTITADSMEKAFKARGPKGGHGPKDPTEMFKDLAEKVGADENGITKDDLTTYLKKLQEEGKGDSKEAKMISNLVEDFDNVSGGTDTITADSIQKAMQNRKPPSRFDFQDPSTVTSDQLKSPIDIRV